MKGHCILSHGFESGPDATKVTALAEVAERLGWSHERPDYTDLDARRGAGELGDVSARLQRLLGLAKTAASRGPLVLAGSSLGAWISGAASLQAPVRGLFGSLNSSCASWSLAFACGSSAGAAKLKADTHSSNKAVIALMLFSLGDGQGVEEVFAI